MKHAEQRQAGSEYDKQADDRLVKAAYDFNLRELQVQLLGYITSTTNRSAAIPAPVSISFPAIHSHCAIPWILPHQ
jgi:hypothetical protein